MQESEPVTGIFLGKSIVSKPEHDQSGKASAVTGMAWMFGSNVLCRVIGFGGQLALGWLLTPREFGLYALALSISMAVGALRNGGAGQILIQRGSDYHALAGPLTKYSLWFNLSVLTLLSVIAPTVPWLLGSWELAWMIFCIALSFPLGTLGMIFRSKLSIDRRFEDLAKIAFSSTFVWQGSVVVLALLGFGPFSFVVPLIFQALYESLAGWFYVRQMPRLTDHLSVEMFYSLFRETRWIMSSTALLSLAITGDYFVVGLISGKDTVGIYFFAFQLVISLAQLFNNGVETVFPSLLRSLNNDKTRQAAAFYKTVKMLLLAVIPVSMAFAFLASPLIHMLWQGKWDSAITAVQLLTACIPAWLVVSSGRALLEARGLWRMRFMMLTAYGMGGMVSAGLGAMAGGVTEIALAVSGFYVFFSLVVMAVGSRVVDFPRANILKSAYMPLLLSLICAVASIFLVGRVFNEYPSLLKDLAAFLTFSLFVFAGNIVVFKEAWKEIAETFLHSVRRRVDSQS